MPVDVSHAPLPAASRRRQRHRSRRHGTCATQRARSLAVVDLAHLIALKLYAGGSKSTSDVVELLERTRGRADIDDIRNVCTKCGLIEALDKPLDDLGI